MESAASIRPFSKSVFISLSDNDVSNFTIGTFINAWYTGLFLSQSFFTATSTENVPPPMNPKTTIKIKGNNNVKTTADGLRIVDRKLALVIASIAFSWLYFDLSVSIVIIHFSMHGR